MTTNLQQGTLLDVLKKKMRQTKEEMEKYKDECEEYHKKLQLEVVRREEVSGSTNFCSNSSYFCLPPQRRGLIVSSVQPNTISRVLLLQSPSRLYGSTSTSYMWLHIPIKLPSVRQFFFSPLLSILASLLHTAHTLHTERILGRG